MSCRQIAEGQFLLAGQKELASAVKIKQTRVDFLKLGFRRILNCGEENWSSLVDRVTRHVTKIMRAVISIVNIVSTRCERLA